MKKCLICLLFAAVLFASCKSTSKKQKSKAEAPANTEAVAADENTGSENSEASETSEESAAKTDAQETSDSKDSKKSKDKKSSKTSEEKGNYTGWIKSKGKDITETFGIMQLKTHAKFGSYTISLLNDKNKYVPVLSASNEFTTNAFYLKNSRKTYCLTSDTSIKNQIQKKEDGLSILYTVPDVADVSVDFKCMATEKKGSYNMLKVTMTVTNKSKRNDEFHLKSILDTTLGEADDFHFYTWEGVPVKNEVLYRTLQNQKWFVSKNNSAAMQFFYSGADCTVPALVALANYSTLEKNIWEPDMASFRAFDTVLSYNNSAVCAVWNPLKLAVNESGKVIFYLAFAVDGIKPNGENVIFDKTAPKLKPVEAAPAVEVIKDAAISGGYSLVEDLGDEEMVSDVSENSENLKNPETPAAVPTVDFYIQNMTNEQLTPEYIQALLDRIAALEEDSPLLNRQELLQLNAELDAILTYLRQ